MESFDNIKTFIAVAETGSNNKASKHLNVNESTISRRMKSLTDSLGFELFNRDGNRQLLTQKGKQYYSFAKKVMNERAVTLSSINGKEVLRIANPFLYYPLEFVDIFISYENNNQHLVSIIDCTFDDLFDRLINNEIDLAFTSYSSRLERLNNFRFQPIISVPVSILVSKVNKLYSKDTISITDLENQVINLDFNYQNDVYEFFNKSEKTLKLVHMRSDSFNSFINVLKKNEIMIITDSYLQKLELHSSKIIPINDLNSLFGIFYRKDKETEALELSITIKKYNNL